MKRLLCVLLCAIFISGCAMQSNTMDNALTARTQLQKSNGCTFKARITADYGEEIHQFTMACQWDTSGKMEFEILQPDSICGITGHLSASDALLTFDDTVLAFSPLADGQIAPVVSPWLVLHSLSGGYLSATSDTADGYLLYIDDVYMGETLQVQISMDAENLPVAAEIYWQSRRILTVHLDGFSYM